MRGEPRPANVEAQLRQHFNSLAPCGANHEAMALCLAFVHFNSLAPCGANPGSMSKIGKTRAFQLTRPVRGEPRWIPTCCIDTAISTHSPRAGRTDLPFEDGYPYSISTHSPRAGRTSVVRVIDSIFGDFNSLAPCGANPAIFYAFRLYPAFQLTRPVRGEPSARCISCATQTISTHSPRAGRTLEE